MEFEQYTLGDEAVIEFLLLMRYKFDEKIHMTDPQITMMASGGYKLNEEIIATYASLDRCISKSKLNENQTKLLQMINEGYNNDEIAFELGINPTRVGNRLRTICKRIKLANDWEWRKTTLKSLYNLKTKKCTLCKEELPATPEFFGDDNRNLDGFQGRCKLCKR